ncbi:MAG TPA: NAD(P)H-binding protein [Longimicrobiales bacterium]|nr:NAD(P)H-binding protein [Longimicrobiales bacterium]
MTVTTTRTAFVAGATGYTGRALVDELLSRGIRTVAHVRPDSARREEWRTHFENAGAVVDLTPWDDDALADTLARDTPDAVFALLGTTRARMRGSGGRDTYEAVDYGLTAMLLRAVRRGAPDARFIYLSSAGVGPSARGEYLRVRWRLEQELRASGAPWTIVRPAFITGADRDESRPLERIAGSVIDGALRIAGALGASTLRERYASVDAQTLARGLAHYGFDDSGAGRVLGAADIRGSGGLHSSSR